MPLIITDTQHNNALNCYECSNVEFRIARFIYCYAECRQAECCYAECQYAKCRYAECRGAKNKAYSEQEPFCLNFE